MVERRHIREDDGNVVRGITAAEYNDRLAKAMPEKVLQEHVRQLLLVYGWRHYHTHLAKHSPAGFPDECAIRGDRLIFAELKSARGKLSPAQEAWLADLRAWADLLHGAAGLPSLDVYVWRPADLFAGRIEEALR